MITSSGKWKWQSLRERAMQSNTIKSLDCGELADVADAFLTVGYILRQMAAEQHGEDSTQTATKATSTAKPETFRWEHSDEEKLDKWRRVVIEDPCPECGESQVILHNPARGISFFGCSSYPRCTWRNFPHSGGGAHIPVDMMGVGMDIDELDEEFPGMCGDELGVDWIGAIP